MFNFELKEGERLILALRQTKLILARPFVIVLIAIYLPWNLLLKYELFSQYKFLLGIWTVIWLLYFIYKYSLWLINISLITSRRLVNIHYCSLIKKQVTETPWDRVLNISYKSEGFFSTIFNFGDVEVKINVVQEPLALKNISKPSEIKDVLWEMHSKIKASSEQFK